MITSLFFRLFQMIIIMIRIISITK